EFTKGSPVLVWNLALPSTAENGFPAKAWHWVHLSISPDNLALGPPQGNTEKNLAGSSFSKL
ncbi:MAG TPA: hypothetical protein PKV71_18460, partial [Calditrichia bacterium]|nr:hypothetical protein [Calditrichia bacterium]